MGCNLASTDENEKNKKNTSLYHYCCILVSSSPVYLFFTGHLLNALDPEADVRAVHHLHGRVDQSGGAFESRSPVYIETSAPINMSTSNI